MDNSENHAIVLELPDSETDVHRRRPEPRSGGIGGLVAVVVIAGLAWMLVADRQPLVPPVDPEPPSTTLPTPVDDEEPPPTALLSSGDPRVSGSLENGATFEVYEQTPGVLCVELSDVESSAPEKSCHLELTSGSGPAVINEMIVFGYLPPGAASASLRYRSGLTGNDGIRVEPAARFFALPIEADDAYRLQYRSHDYEIRSEVPLVALSAGPSQTPEHARRDGVPTATAALPFNRRVDVVADWFHAGTPFAWSQSTDSALEPGWSELLRLDATGTQIDRAVPLPGVELVAEVWTTDALFVTGVLEPPGPGGAEAAAIVARLANDPDDDTLVVVFPDSASAAAGSLVDNPWVDQLGWQIGPIGVAPVPDRIGATDRWIQLSASGRTLLLDPLTLLPR